MAVGPDDVVSCIWTTSEGLHALGLVEGDSDEPHSANSSSVEAVLTTYAPLLDCAARVSGVLPSYPALQPLPCGRFLWVGARAIWHPDSPENNALIFDADGALVLAACIGDGIEHVQTSRTGEVWLGFSDEGVYGNMGWGGPGPTPLGHSGIARYSSALKPQWEFPEHISEVVDDCYALNVTTDDVWAYYYSDFPIVRITSDGVVTSWRTHITGAKALVTDGDCAALIGGYRKEADRVILGRLEEDFTQLAATKLVMPDNSSLPEHAFVQGRGEHLHVFVGSAWFRADLSQLV